MNAFVAELVQRHGPRVTGLATVYPGEPDAVEFAAYAALLRRCDNLWLDTTMMLGGYFAVGELFGL